jgi:hypothetical protein
MVSFLRTAFATDINIAKSRSIARGYEDVVALRDGVASRAGTPIASADDDTQPESVLGYVYLMKSGRYYKVGRSNAVGRCERELAIQLPEKANVVHSIKTDDPAGIESY